MSLSETKRTISGSDIISYNNKPFENDEKCILFTLKAFLFLIFSNFYNNFFGHIRKRLDKKVVEVNFKIYDVIDWETIHILSNISRIKSNETMKFGRSIEHNIGKKFLKRPYTRGGGGANA